jgi:hypothetical protein
MDAQNFGDFSISRRQQIQRAGSKNPYIRVSADDNKYREQEVRTPTYVYQQTTTNTESRK